MTNKSSATAILATYAAELKYEDLPPEVRVALKHLFLDTLGTTLAGSTLGVGCREVIEVVRSWGGCRRVPFLVSERRCRP